MLQFIRSQQVALEILYFCTVLCVFFFLSIFLSFNIILISVDAYPLVLTFFGNTFILFKFDNFVEKETMYVESHLYVEMFSLFSQSVKIHKHVVHNFINF